jgi:hypothetical protein
METLLADQIKTERRNTLITLLETAYLTGKLEGVRGDYRRRQQEFIDNHKTEINSILP